MSHGYHSPIPVHRQPTKRLKPVTKGGVPRTQALPNIRELAGFLGSDREYGRARRQVTE